MAGRTPKGGLPVISLSSRATPLPPHTPLQGYNTHTHTHPRPVYLPFPGPGMPFPDPPTTIPFITIVVSRIHCWNSSSRNIFVLKLNCLIFIFSFSYFKVLNMRRYFHTSIVLCHILYWFILSFSFMTGGAFTFLFCSCIVHCCIQAARRFTSGWSIWRLHWVVGTSGTGTAHLSLHVPVSSSERTLAAGLAVSYRRAPTGWLLSHTPSLPMTGTTRGNGAKTGLCEEVTVKLRREDEEDQASWRGSEDSGKK